jgi:hypothetical protein
MAPPKSSALVEGKKKHGEKEKVSERDTRGHAKQTFK